MVNVRYNYAGVSMKTSVLVGIVLIVLGILALVYPQISYTKREKILDVGPIEATAETRETVPIAPIVGGVAIVGGVILILTGGRRTV